MKIIDIANPVMNVVDKEKKVEYIDIYVYLYIYLSIRHLSRFLLFHLSFQ